MTPARPIIFGEVLFDRFPDGSAVLGGAPFNVAWHLQAFGCEPVLVTRVGRDALGERVLNACAKWGLDAVGLQVDGDVETSTVDVTFKDGEPQYDIVKPRAFDRIDAQQLPSFAAAPLIYHGSLALRSAPSRAAFDALVAATRAPRFIDVNLRTPWWSRDAVIERCREARWVKLNTDEWDVVVGEPDVSPRSVLEAFDLDGILITRGAEGADFVTRDIHERVVPHAVSEVVDTVGAGDAFASVMLLGLLSRWPAHTTLQRAQHFASRIVGVRGATVDDRAFYATVMNDWSDDGLKEA